MAYSVEDCRGMVQAARSARKNLQVGHQRAYSPLYHEAYQILKSGAIGDVFHVRAVWHRNGSWRKNLPAEPFNPSQWGYLDLEHLTNWRLYSKYSHGLMSELCSHQIHAINWFMGQVPQSVMATGGIHRYKDGREVNDHVYAIFEYPRELTVSYSSIQSNAFDHYYEEFMGTNGTIVLSGETEALLFMEGQKGKMTEITTRPDVGGAMLEASESRARDAAGSAVGGTSTSGVTVFTAYKKQLEGFCRTIRNGEPNLCDGEVGLQSAAAILKADEAAATQAGKIPLAKELYAT